jgi:hypothetical protein
MPTQDGVSDALAEALEDARARRAYGVPSGVNNILVINKVMTPGRVTAIIVKEHWASDHLGLVSKRPPHRPARTSS